MNNYLIKLLDKLRILKKFNLVGSIEINHRKFKVPVIEGNGLLNLYAFEPWMIDLLKSIFQIEKGPFIDIGVNIGQTLLKVKSLSSEIDYIGFEPNPTCVYYVNRLIEENNLIKAKVIPVGISDKVRIGILNYFNSTDTDNSASIVEDFRHRQNVVRQEYVPIFNLRAINDVLNFDCISVIKIDVEGAELEVIKSFQSLIIEKQPIVILEILPAYSEKNIFRLERQRSVERFFQKIQYSMFNLVKLENALVNAIEVTEIPIHSDLNRCDYVMVPQAKRHYFRKENNS